MCEPAVRDAETNAKVNGIQNCVFMAGRAEAKIRDAIKQYVPEGGSCVAVVDPPREGLHPKVISVLRQTEAIERIVYVSCNHVNFIDQAVKLCSPVTAKYSGEPFEIVDANGVDLFPHTHHVELVALLERGATLAKRRAVEVDRESCCVGVREGEPRVSAQIDREHHKAGAAAEALSVGQKVSTAVDGRADGQEVLT